jgi:hypothetical protein
METAYLMEDRSLFISSCSRRDLARRRPGRKVSRWHFAFTLAVFLIALAVVFAVRGGF